MRLYITLLFCLALLSVGLAKKPSKPSKPGKGKPTKPIKPAKPSPVKPTATERPPKPVEAEVESLNEMFDQKAFESMPGCLPCMKSTWMLDCITTCYDSKDYAPEKCLVCLLENAPMCVAPCGKNLLIFKNKYILVYPRLHQSCWYWSLAQTVPWGSD